MGIKEKILFLIKALGVIAFMRLALLYIASAGIVFSILAMNILFWKTSDKFWNDSVIYATLIFVFFSEYLIFLLFGIFKFIENYNKFIQILIIAFINYGLYLSLTLFPLSSDDKEIFIDFVFFIPFVWIFRQFWCFFRDFRKKQE